MTARVRPLRADGEPDDERALTSVAVFATSPMVADGLAQLLGREQGLRVVGSTSDLPAVTSLVAQGMVDVVVVGLFNSPDRDHQSILGALAEAADGASGPVRTVCVISTERSTAADLVSWGASAVLTSADPPRNLIDAVATTSAIGMRRMDLRAAVTEDIGQSAALQRFHITQRELEVLEGIAEGLRTKEIAERLGISANTVRTHVQHLLPKLGAHSRLKATAVAIDEGLLNRPVRPRTAPPA